MYLAIHVPMFGSANIESKPLICSECASNDWIEKDITICNPDDQIVCSKCCKIHYINWGLVEPDHLSSWINSEYCSHRLCIIKYKELCELNKWKEE